MIVEKLELLTIKSTVIMKKKYCMPIIEESYVVCESCIAAYSGNVTFGGDNNEIAPRITEWEETNTGYMREL